MRRQNTSKFNKFIQFSIFNKFNELNKMNFINGYNRLNPLNPLNCCSTNVKPSPCIEIALQRPQDLSRRMDIMYVEQTFKGVDVP